MHAQSLQSCSTLCEPMDCGPPGSSVRGILQVIFPAQESNLHLLSTCIGRWVLYYWHHLGSPVLIIHFI